jgi:uncharacterized membrane protein YjjB (DUF3815 family)
MCGLTLIWEEELMRTFLSCIVLAVINVGIAYLHAVYFGDRIARVTGYFVDLYIIPAVFGLITGTLVIELLNHDFSAGLKSHWWIIIVGIIFALLPSLYYVIGMTFFMKGS